MAYFQKVFLFTKECATIQSITPKENMYAQDSDLEHFLEMEPKYYSMIFFLNPACIVLFYFTEKVQV